MRIRVKLKMCWGLRIYRGKNMVETRGCLDVLSAKWHVNVGEVQVNLWTAMDRVFCCADSTPFQDLVVLFSLKDVYMLWGSMSSCIVSHLSSHTNIFVLSHAGQQMSWVHLKTIKKKERKNWIWASASIIVFSFIKYLIQTQPKCTYNNKFRK